MNLYNAVALAAEPNARGRGVLVVNDTDIHFAREVVKSHTARLDSFESPNRGRAGMITDGKAQLFSPPGYRYGTRSEFSVNGTNRLPPVEIVYSHANLRRYVIDYMVEKGVKGIILAGVGDGNTTTEALEGLHDAVKRGVIVVRSTRVANGFTRRNVEIDDDRMGFVVSEDLSPQKARVLLMLALMRTSNPSLLQHYFYEY
jgi:L-asparaginase